MKFEQRKYLISELLNEVVYFYDEGQGIYMPLYDSDKLPAEQIVLTLEEYINRYAYELKQQKKQNKSPITQGHRKKLFTLAQAQEMKAMKDNGINVTDIAKHFKCSRKTVYNYLRKLGS